MIERKKRRHRQNISFVVLNEPDPELLAKALARVFFRESLVLSDEDEFEERLKESEMGHHGKK